MLRQPFDYGRFTPVDQLVGGYIVSKSAYANLRFAVSSIGTYQIGSHDAGNLPGLAYKLYQDVSMWRILLAFNGLQDALQDVIEGLVINYPDKSEVLAYLAGNQTKTSNTPTLTI